MSLQDLCKAVETGDQDRGKDLAQKLVDGGTNPLEIIDALTKVMDEIGEKFTRLEIFLPEMMMSGEAMSKVVEILTPHLKKGGGGEPKGKVVLGTVKGDLHEIGKTLVGTVLTANGFQVTDIGINKPADEFIAAVKETNATLIGASALLTTTIPEQQKIIEALVEAGLRDKVKVMVGGAPVTQAWADKIGADGYAEDAIGAVAVAKRLVGA